MNFEKEQIYLQICERLSKQFYWFLDRFETDNILNIVHGHCEWVRAGVPHRGHDAMRRIMDERRRDITGRHLVCNAVAKMTSADNIEVNFDLVYHAAPKPSESGSPLASQNAKILSGLDMYRFENERWELIFKKVIPLF